MPVLLKQLWRDETGAVGSAEVMFIMTLMCIGMLVGIKSLRDAAVTEFADFGQALSNLDQSYSFTPTPPAGGTVATSFFEDGPDFCDTPTDDDTGTSGSKCVNVCVAAQGE